MLGDEVGREVLEDFEEFARAGGRVVFGVRHGGHLLQCFLIYASAEAASTKLLAPTGLWTAAELLATKRVEAAETATAKVQRPLLRAEAYRVNADSAVGGLLGGIDGGRAGGGDAVGQHDYDMRDVGPLGHRRGLVVRRLIERAGGNV